MIGLVISSFVLNASVSIYTIQNSSFESYIEITTAKQLCTISLEENLNKNFILKNDIDLTEDLSWQETLLDSENGFLPINAINNFGIFDGNGYIIKGLFINRPVLDKVGLFSESKLTIKNLSIEYLDEQSFNLIGGDLVGGLAATNFGTISHCSIKANIKSTNSAGGLVGINEGDIYNSFFEGIVYGKLVGGLIGKCNAGLINNCYSSGNLYSKIAGGFIGESIYDNIEIMNSFSFIKIFDNTDESGPNNFGSFLGIRGSGVEIDNCYSLNNIAVVYQGIIA